jgi:hypothetical protein
MTTTNNTGILASLRAPTTNSSPSLSDLFYVAEQQARLLQELLAATADPLLSRLTDLIPTLCIDTLDAMPVGGTSFWGNERWHIHLRQGDPTDFHHFTVLHQLKHIVDYPLRQRLSMVRDADWEAVADYFATSVLRPPKKAGEYIEYTTREEGRL